jgi:hypothetical protein
VPGSVRAEAFERKIIRQGVGSEIDVSPRDEGTIHARGRTEIVEMREFS